jgi:hypothetical protein
LQQRQQQQRQQGSRLWTAAGPSQGGSVSQRTAGSHQVAPQRPRLLWQPGGATAGSGDRIPPRSQQVQPLRARTIETAPPGRTGGRGRHPWLGAYVITRQALRGQAGYQPAQQGGRGAGSRWAGA